MEYASNLESPYQSKKSGMSTAPGSSTGTSARSSRIHRSKITDLVLRILAVVLSLIAFATMVSDSKSALRRDSAGNTFRFKLKYSDFDSTKAVLAANVLVCVYSVAQTVGAFISILAGHGLMPTPLSEYISFILDQVFAYFLLATFASGATLVSSIRNGSRLIPSLCKGTGFSGFCTVAEASLSMNFLTFAALASSSVQSGYFLAKYISNS